MKLSEQVLNGYYSTTNIHYQRRNWIKLAEYIADLEVQLAAKNEYIIQLESAVNNLQQNTITAMSERDALREALQYVDLNYDEQYGFSDGYYVINKVRSALAATKENDGE